MNKTKEFSTYPPYITLGSKLNHSEENQDPANAINVKNHHSKFCTRDPRCLKCAGPHATKECTKRPDEAPKCAFCSESILQIF
ncbi:hypothetical protein CEXT_356501 [Caerostris extrusa]|uniref:Uncharacterized protein n=1 Tax=Caerostris extrusa TaxID=172846 RepID=A0AAV4XQ71_CAEEX|nr:hypothetical protein CEXT_356501 [Caerostris extrusa]